MKTTLIITSKNVIVLLLNKYAERKMFTLLVEIQEKNFKIIL